MKLAAAIACVCASLASAQRGDQKGEEQPPLPAEWRVPTPKPLSAEEELATFRVDEGLRVELVACEPLVRDPVCATFDERGRLWVVEMSGYMRDVDGAGEDQPLGAVVVLRDDDGDGRMDAREVFLDELVLPRAIAPTRGGALIIAPPHLLFARDTDADGRADDVRVVDSGLSGRANPEHAINGLLYGLDNWFWCANAPFRYRWNGDVLERGRTAGGGQWGIGEDKWGRIFLNDNSNPLRCDLYPSHYAVRNPALGVAPGMNVNIAAGARPAPSHMTPGVNRGYRKGLLADGRLNEFTGACAPWIYEGDALPERYRGNALVCEPCGNLVHRFEITYDERGFPKASTAPPDGAFLTSTDERFRPVWLNEGPDGALYVVDMYRGVLQHKLFVTSWLRAQVKERELEQPLGRGRIWRVTSGERVKPSVDLASCSWTELASCFDSPNRWVRKTAQRLFVEQGDAVAVEVLRESLSRPLPSVERSMHTLWALAGLGRLDDAFSWVLRLKVRSPLAFGLLDASMQSDSMAEAVAERILDEPGVTDSAFAIPRDAAWLGLLTLGEARTANAMKAMASVAWQFRDDPLARGALLSGLKGRELEFLRASLNRMGNLPQTSTDSALQLLHEIAACAVRDGTEVRTVQLLNWIVGMDLERRIQIELARGAVDALGKDANGQAKPLRLANRPQACDWFEVRHALEPVVNELFDAVIWPGKPGTEGLWPRELDDAERARFERGRGIFEQTCASCHQLSGRGDPGVAPPLVDAPRVLGDAETLTKLLLHGLRGRIERNGFTWDGEMPGFTASDDEVAAVLTYLRREWHHGAQPITPEFVRSVREKHAGRKQAWSVEELTAK